MDVQDFFFNIFINGFGRYMSFVENSNIIKYRIMILLYFFDDIFLVDIFGEHMI